MREPRVGFALLLMIGKEEHRPASEKHGLQAHPRSKHVHVMSACVCRVMSMSVCRVMSACVCRVMSACVCHVISPCVCRVMSVSVCRVMSACVCRVMSPCVCRVMSVSMCRGPPLSQRAPLSPLRNKDGLASPPRKDPRSRDGRDRPARGPLTVESFISQREHA